MTAGRTVIRFGGRAGKVVVTLVVALSAFIVGPAQAPPDTATRAPTAVASGMRSTTGTAALPQVVRRGTTLREINPRQPNEFLDGNYRFTGVDAYELNSLWSDNVGCGAQQSDAQLDALFSTLGPNAVARVWFFQQFATNRYSGEIDWKAMDRTVALAAAHGVRLIATLGNQDGACDDGTWKDPQWYGGGYRSRTGSYALSYLQWVQAVTARYASNPAVLAWEPMNEPRPDTCTEPADCWNNRICPDTTGARDALRSFYDTVGAAIRAADPNHLISDGAPPVAGCGTATWADVTDLDRSPGIDLVSYHDYSGGMPMSASDVTARRALSAQVNKPIFAGEDGGTDAAVVPAAGQGCPTQTDRSEVYSQQITGNFRRLPALVGWLFWDAMPAPDETATICDYATWPGDPLLTMLREEEVQLNAR